MGHMTATSPPAKARRTGGRSARVREAVLRATLDALLAGGADDPKTLPRPRPDVLGALTAFLDG